MSNNIDVSTIGTPSATAWYKTTATDALHTPHQNIDALPAAVESAIVDIAAYLVPPTLTFATGTAASSGDNTLIAAPGANVQIVIVGFQLQNESAVTSVTTVLKFGATAKYRALLAAGAFAPSYGKVSWKVGDNTALVLNLSAAVSTGYTIWYYTEAV